MARPRRHAVADLLEHARTAVRQAAEITVDQFRTQLGGGTLSEISGVLRAARMELGLLPWTPETVPAPIRELLVCKPVSDGASDFLTAGGHSALEPVLQLLSASRDAVEHAVASIHATALARMTAANATAEQQALTAWRSCQELVDASRTLEAERDTAQLQVITERANAADARHALDSELSAVRHALDVERSQGATDRAALEEARNERGRVLRELAAAASALERSRLETHGAEQRAAVAETRVAEFARVEATLSEVRAEALQLRADVMISATETAALREALAQANRETARLRNACEHAQREATEAAKTAGAQARELELLRARLARRNR